MGFMSDEKTELTGFQKEIKNVQAAIADFESGKKLNIAIIAEPFAGRTAIANEIEKNQRAEGNQA